MKPLQVVKTGGGRGAMDNDYLTPASINKQVVKRGGGRGAWITIISPPVFINKQVVGRE